MGGGGVAQYVQTTLKSFQDCFCRLRLVGDGELLVMRDSVLSSDQIGTPALTSIFLKTNIDVTPNYD